MNWWSRFCRWSCEPDYEPVPSPIELAKEELYQAEQALLDAMQRASDAENELKRLKSIRRSRGPKAVKKAARRKK